MANEKILVLEAPWSDDIEDTQATHDIYASAETLLRTGAEPVRMIHRPLIAATYAIDIERFLKLKCNRRGINLIVLSAHGNITRDKWGRRKVTRRHLTAFDGEIDLNDDIKHLRSRLSRSIIILDSCELGESIGAFHRRSKALGVVGFGQQVDWVDSSLFVLAMLFKLHEENVFNLKKKSPRAQKVITDMIRGTYKSVADSLHVKKAFSNATRVQSQR